MIKKTHKKRLLIYALTDLGRKEQISPFRNEEVFEERVQEAVEERLKGLRFKLPVPGLKLRFTPTEDNLRECREFRGFVLRGEEHSPVPGTRVAGRHLCIVRTGQSELFQPLRVLSRLFGGKSAPPTGSAARDGYRFRVPGRPKGGVRPSART